MEKSNDSIERTTAFFGTQQAHLREWGWACLLLGVGLVSHGWREATWRARLDGFPSMTTTDLLCWLEERPTPERWSSRKTWSPPQRENMGRAPVRPRKTASAEARPEVVLSLDINQATAEEWDALPGFGPVLSLRTVKFREAMGGFASVDQLYMVYGLDSATVLNVKGQLVVDADDIEPLCMDSLTFRRLVRHPLFDAEATRDILRAWGRGASSMDAFWDRLNPSAENRERWGPYLHMCEPRMPVYE